MRREERAREGELVTLEPEGVQRVAGVDLAVAVERARHALDHVTTRQRAPGEPEKPGDAHSHNAFRGRPSEAGRGTFVVGDGRRISGGQASAVTR